jgi:hypothetical protein
MKNTILQLFAMCLLAAFVVSPNVSAKGEIEFLQNGRFENESSSPPFSSEDSLKSFLPSSLF